MKANSYPRRSIQGWGGEGSLETLHRVVDMLQYFETILTSVESLWSSQQDEVYFMGGGAAGGLWRHQKRSLPYILPRVRNQVKKMRELVIFCAWHVRKHINKYFPSFYPQVLLSSIQGVEKNIHFHPTIACPLATYDVVFHNHSNWPSLSLPQNAHEG